MSIGHEVRAEFPIFEHAVYANSCSQGALANRVRAAAEEWLAGWDENGAEWEFWVERNEAARTAFARLLHAEPDDVAVTTSVSQGVSALVSALDLSGERNRIVISEYEFPTVGQIAHAQELRGAKVVHVTPEADGRIPVSASPRPSTSGRRSSAARLSRSAPDTATTCQRSPTRPRERRDRPCRQLPGDRCDRVGLAHARRRRRHGVAPSSTCSAPPVSVSCGSATPCARSCSRRRPVGSPTKTSSRCPSPTTRRTRRRGASTAARRRCRRSIPAWRGWS